MIGHKQQIYYIIIELFIEKIVIGHISTDN